MRSLAAGRNLFYFENKEELIGFLVLDSMKKLYGYITSALEQQEETRARYDLICQGLVLYQEEFPFYFKMVLDKINIDFEGRKFLPEEKETYQIGEEILELMPTIFHFWGMLSGLIQLAANKEAYIQKEMHLSKDQFLKYGFDMLYRSI